MRFADPIRGDMLIRSPVARYAFSVAIVAAALGLRVLLTPFTGRGAPFVLFFGATLLTSLAAGVGPAVLTVVLSIPIASLEFVLGAGFPASEAVAQAGLFAIDGIVVIYMTMLMRHRREGLQATNRQLQLANEERERTLVRMRETIELAPDAYFLADQHAHYVDVNQAACQLLGYERGELLSMRIYDVILPEEAARLRAARDELLEPGRVMKSEWLLRRKDGSLVTTEVSANALSEGRWQAFIRDISERKRVEDLRQVFMSLLDNSPDFIGIADPSGKPIYVNAAGRRMVGLAPDFPVEQTEILNYYPPDLRTFVTDVLLKTMMERGQWSGETFFQNLQTHERIPVSDTHFTIRDVSGKRVLGYATITRDISEARRISDEREELFARERLAREQAESANAALRLSEAKFSGIISIAADAIISVDKDQRISIFNEGAEEIFGYTRGEVLGTQLSQLIPERFRAIHNEHFARFMSGAQVARKMGERQDIFGLRKNGEEFPAEASISKVAVGGATLFSVVLRDVTYSKNVEKALQLAINARDDVLRIVAHDLRNPLNTIVMQAALLERPGPEMERRDQTPRLVIKRSAERMEHLIQDLLDAALAEAGELKVARDRISAAELTRDAMEMQKPLASAEGVELCLEVDPAVRDVWGDRNRLLQVFENLIGNALKFTPKDGKVAVGARARAQVVEFFVADTGSGIAPEYLPHVFDRFWQGPARSAKGAGLGLPIAKGIVEAHGGSIRLESTVGQGTTFYFTIPAVHEETGSSELKLLGRGRKTNRAA